MRKMQLIVPLRLRKVIFTLVLVIASSVCMMKAACLMQAPEAMYQPFETVSGTLTSIGFPCEGEEPCPACLTIALVTDAKTYYLSTSDAQMQAQLDELEMQLPLRATISGTPFVNGSFDFIKVQSVSVDNSLLPSLCDEWNIAKISNSTGPMETIHTVKAVLGADTIIEAQHYVKLIEDSKYKGAMREGMSGVIYYIPAGSTHEYLLYNFNAKVGDRLRNLWFGGPAEGYPNGLNATITEISNTSPRVFTLAAELVHAESDAIDTVLVFWTEGVGMETGPVGMDCFHCACSCGQTVLCAYKNGEQVYTSTMGEQYGCVYNYDPYAPSDTIPLYTFTGDDPGSSTVDPVDPNQVVVTLKGDELTIKESSGETILYRLTNTSSDAASAPYRVPQAQTPQSFQNEINITLTEEGTYSLILTNPDWGYGIYGTFSYPNRKDAIDNTPSPSKENQGKVSKLILSDGQILILRGEKIYTIQGQRVK